MSLQRADRDIDFMRAAASKAEAPALYRPTLRLRRLHESAHRFHARPSAKAQTLAGQ